MSERKSAPWRKIAAGGALCAALVAGVWGGSIERATVAWAAGFFTNGVCTAGSTGTSTGSPAVTFCNNSNTYPLTGNEQVPADTELSGGQSPQSEAITVAQLGGYDLSQASRGNALAGGDATTNTFVHGTTGSTVNTTATYGGPTDWFYWSGTSTNMTVSQDSTAADVPAGYLDSFKMARTSGQTGVVQVCMGQEVESVASYQFQGAVAELDFHARAGANFSGASSNMTAYIIYGTAADEGSSKMAFGLNGGGGGNAAWTGQANATAAVIPISTTLGRYAAIASIPTTAKELGVALCWTPVGTAGTNDYISFAGIQLVRNQTNLGAVNATAGFSCAAGGVQCMGFDRKPLNVDVGYQQRYATSIVEGGAASHPLFQSMLSNGTSTTCYGFIPYPVPMRAAPSYSNALTASTFKLLANASGTMTAAALSTPFSAVTDSTTGNGTLGAQLTFTASGLAGTVGDTCVLEGIGGGGTILFSAEL